MRSSTSAEALASAGERGRRGYENRMVAITSLTVGFVAFDRLALGYLAPYLVKAFGLDNTDVGALYAAQAGAAALFGYLSGIVSDRTGWRKRIVVPLLVVMAVFNLFSAAAPSFLLLLVARTLAGASEGPIATLSQSIVSMQSSSHRRGLNMGVLTLCMFLVSQMASPVILTHLADKWGWSAGLLAPALPALLLAVMAGWLLREQSAPPERQIAADALRDDERDRDGTLFGHGVYSLLLYKGARCAGDKID